MSSQRRTRRTWPRLVCALVLFSGCRAFPISMYVPDEALDVLDTCDYVDRLDPLEVERELRARFAFAGLPAADDGTEYHRLARGLAPEPFPPEALDDVTHPAVADLRSGDLLLAKNAKPQSLGQTLTFVEFTFYSHMGILAEEGGRLWVYESWPRLDFLTPAEDFAARFRGGVQKVPFGSFVARYETTEVVRLPDDELAEELPAAAAASLREGIAYDPHHDPDDPALSCSEYVAYLIEDKLGRPLALRPREVTRNPSMQALLGSLGFRTDAYVVPEAFAELPGARTVALLSRQPTYAAYLGKRHAYAALHEHFLANSTIGSYLAIDPWRLVRFRPNVDEYLRWAIGYAESIGASNPAGLRRDLELMLELFFRRKDGLLLP